MKNRKVKMKSRGFTPSREKDNENVFSLSSNAGGAKAPRAFTLLIAVLVSSILLALGFAIFNIVSKEIILSSSGRESQFAFYAADSGVECALYWDYKQGAFSSSTPQIPECGGGEVTNYSASYEPLTDTLTTSFDFSLGGSVSNPCTSVTVTKEENETVTTIRSSGFNTCVTTNPRRLERAIRVQY